MGLPRPPHQRPGRLPRYHVHAPDNRGYGQPAPLQACSASCLGRRYTRTR